jgi:hypothetical protein
MGDAEDFELDPPVEDDGTEGGGAGGPAGSGDADGGGAGGAGGGGDGAGDGGGDDGGEETEDDPAEAAAAHLESLGLPGGGDFASAVAAAVAHAQDPARAAVASAWTPIGPRNVGGAIRALIQDERNPATFYAGSASGGVWKSVDDGLSWRPLGGPGMVLPAGALALAPGDSRILYVGTGEPHTTELGGRGIFLSTDAGENLVQIVPAVGAGPAVPGAADHYARIAVDTADPSAAGAGKITTAGTAVTGVGGTHFTNFFARSDILSAGGELRIVTTVTSDTSLTVDRPFAADLAAPADYRRASPRFWAAGETGLWRFEPGTGFVAELPFLAVPAGNRATDVVLAQDPANAGQVVLYAGLHRQGLFRGVFTRATRAAAWTRCVLPRAAPGNPDIAAAQIGRVRVTLSRTTPIQVYAVLENQGAVAGDGKLGHPTHVYHSATFGDHFVRRARPFTPAADQFALGFYAMVLEVRPDAPATLIFGAYDLRTSTNSGAAWLPIMDPQQYQAGDRAQHADHHAIVFDVRNRNRVWVAHDGGISMTEAVSTDAAHHFPGWRQRSFGLNVSQFHDVSVHPTLPAWTGGGLRDLGSFLSYGGPTWYPVGKNDGGPLVFTTDPRRFYTSHQKGVDRSTVAAAPNPAALTFFSPLPDVGPPDNPANRMRAQVQLRTGAIPAANRPPFVAVVQGDPAHDNDFLVGRAVRTFRTVDGNTFTAIGPTLAADPDPARSEAVSTLSLVPGQPSTQFWLGTNRGRVFRTGDAAALSPPWPGGATPVVHRIAIVAAGGGLRVAVCSAANQGELFLADVAGPPPAAVNWRRMTDAGGVNGLPPGPFTSLAFDPADPRKLFVGTLAGVYGTTNLPAAQMPVPPVAVATPTWKTFNNGLPLAVVHDLAVVPVTNTLRCATYGRGMFERQLASTPLAFQIPAVKLLIRNHVIDDGRVYAPGNTLTSDPRRAATAALDDLHSFDIRVDAPRFQPFGVIRFGEPLDGAEMDEALTPDSPLLGDLNIVYVQVQNRGNDVAANVEVHLFFAAADGPAAVPDLQAGFRAAYRGELPDGAWQRIPPSAAVPGVRAHTLGAIARGEPAVVRFEWVPPFDLRRAGGQPAEHVALLALTRSAADELDLAGAGDAVAPLVRAERRAAVRISPVTRNPIFVRDGVDDDGTRGAVAWGGRSPDIVVLPAAPPPNVDADPRFTDLDDPRAGDRVRAGINHVLVRVHNRLDVPVRADVDLYRVPLDALDRPAAWGRPLNAPGTMQALDIPPRSWRFTSAVQWNVTDGAAAFVLVAVASVVAGAPPKPDPAAEVASLTALWRFLRTGALADKVAMRALRRA